MCIKIRWVAFSLASTLVWGELGAQKDLPQVQQHFVFDSYFSPGQGRLPSLSAGSPAHPRFVSCFRLSSALR